MSSISKDQQFHAYELLRKLDTYTAQTMSQVVYGVTSSSNWRSDCDQHRRIFEEWMAFAATMHLPEPPDED
ncbi:MULTISPECIES: hypothetical protein [Pseudomonas]|uniref:hypothetical protein n=1 Tax=Pseudomonas TaxID=286 RepID=UPI00091CE0FB|nr:MULTISPECIES: hypothetical protein [Pseudomonas]MRF40083.1 hypothetical protein [Escherichia coli]OII59083.1 hypothetical protein BIW19_01355 [Pseudomonas putida]